MAHGGEEASSQVHSLCQKNTFIRDGPPVMYRLITTRSNLDTNGKVGKWTFGQRDITKPNKILLMVGETGTGKTTMINCFVNYALQIKFEDKVWFEITEERTSDESISQTNNITLYEIFVPHSEISLTIIDTPGYGNTKGAEHDKQIAENLYDLFVNDTGVKDIDAVCLVIKASENRLSERQLYIFDTILSVFGKDIGENIVILATHSDGGRPINAINAINKADIPCKKDEKNNPQIYTFNNRHSELWNDDDDDFYQGIWMKTKKSCETFFKGLDSIKRKSLKQTEGVLLESTQLKAILNNLHGRIELLELKENELDQTQKVLKDNKEKIDKDENFTFTVIKSCKVKVPIEGASWWNKKATCCSVCEENCHEYYCWCAPRASWCKVMTKEHCVVCTQKCHQSKHVKENKKYVTNIENVSMTYEDLKKQYEENSRRNIDFDLQIFDKIKIDHEENTEVRKTKMSLENKVKAELTKTKDDKAKWVIKACESITRLCEIALKPDSAFIVERLDYLIPQADAEWAEKLKQLRQIKPEAHERVQSVLKFFRNQKSNPPNKK